MGDRRPKTLMSYIILLFCFLVFVSKSNAQNQDAVYRHNDKVLNKGIGETLPDSICTYFVETKLEREVIPIGNKKTKRDVKLLLLSNKLTKITSLCKFYKQSRKWKRKPYVVIDQNKKCCRKLFCKSKIPEKVTFKFSGSYLELEFVLSVKNGEILRQEIFIGTNEIDCNFNLYMTISDTNNLFYLKTLLEKLEYPIEEANFQYGIYVIATTCSDS